MQSSQRGKRVNAHSQRGKRANARSQLKDAEMQMHTVNRAKGQMYALKSKGQSDVLCRASRLEKASKEFNSLAQRSEQQATAFEHKVGTALPAGHLPLSADMPFGPSIAIP